MFSPLLLSDVTLLHFLQDFSVKEGNGFFPVGPFMFVLTPWSLLLTYPFYKVSCFMTGHSPSCDLLCNSRGGFGSMQQTFQCHGVVGPLRRADLSDSARVLFL